MARLMRHGDAGWRPVGDPLPPFGHAPPDPSLVVAPWVLPREPAPRSGDVVVIGEVAHQLVSRCAPDDPIVAELAEQTMLFQTYDETMRWLAEIDVWIGRRLISGRPWPTGSPG